MNLDAIDVSILDQLQAKGRMNNADLAEEIGLSSSACHRRVRALEAGGIISQYVALLSEEKLGRATSVFVQVTLQNQRRENLAKFEQAVGKCPEIMECFLMTGDADYLLRVCVRDGTDYERLHHDVLTRLPGVQRINSNYAIRKIFRRTALPLAVTKAT
ncbi:Transcriptional regulator, AsnC family [hydrothermal vent metagenome]|uniref:Transcriptional regulator, AsnC family n=1 Tax=hydrothermal vent metagenome TaxID=652676 RepID=A0A3B0R646_9ZZZZ